MALFYGRKKITPIINKGNTIRNQNKTVIVDNTNCTVDQTVEFNENYTGLGTVTVHPDLNISNRTETIEHNGVYQYGNNSSFIREIEVTVDVPLENKTYQIQEADLDSNTLTITPSEGFDGMSSITIDISEITRLLSEI